MPQKPRASVVELIAPDYTPAEDGAGSIVVPRDVRINGVSVYTAGDGIVRIGHVHLGNELVTVNLTLAVRRLVIAAESEADDNAIQRQGDEQTSELVDAHERSRLDLCSALLLSGDTTWRELIEAVTERQRDAAEARAELAKSETARDKLRCDREFWEKAATKNGELYATCENQRDEARRDRDEARSWARHGYEIGQKHCSWSDHGVAPEWLTEGWPPHIDSCEHLKHAAEYDEALTRVRGLPEQPEIMDAQHEQPQGYLHGYRIAIRDAKHAARTDRPQTADEGDSTGRPTHPDGTPYRYHEIKAGGWGHCDGCRTWGQWTADEPHECPGTFNHGPVVPASGG